MEEHLIHKADEFDPTVNNIDFRPVGFGSSGFGTAVIMYHKSSINIRTHELTAPFGFSDGSNWGKNDPTIQVNFNQDRPKDVAFQKGLQQLEELIVMTAFDRRVEWRLFENQRAAHNATMEQVRAKLSKMVRPSRGEYPPTFTAKFMKDRTSGEITTPCHDQDGRPIIPSSETIPKFSRCIFDLQAKTIWISGDGKFGIKWNIQSLTVLPPEARPQTNAPKAYVPPKVFASLGPLPGAKGRSTNSATNSGSSTRSSNSTHSASASANGPPLRQVSSLPASMFRDSDDDDDDDYGPNISANNTSGSKSSLLPSGRALFPESDEE